MSTVLPVPAEATSITGRCFSINMSMKNRTRVVSAVGTRAACLSREMRVLVKGFDGRSEELFEELGIQLNGENNQCEN